MHEYQVFPVQLTALNHFQDINKKTHQSNQLRLQEKLRKWKPEGQHDPSISANMGRLGSGYHLYAKTKEGHFILGSGTPIRGTRFSRPVDTGCVLVRNWELSLLCVSPLVIFWSYIELNIHA